MAPKSVELSRYCLGIILMAGLSAYLVCGEEEEAKRSNPVYSFLKAQRLRSRAKGFLTCGMDDEACIPGTDGCCDGYECRNKFAHVCLYPLEACVCTGYRKVRQ